MRDSVLVLLISASLGFGLQQTALAADMPVKAPIHKAPMVAPVYNWSGFYVGAHIGGAWSDSTLTNSNIGTSWNPGGTGFIGGFQMGYNLQSGNFLFGVEGDFDWTTFDGTSVPVATPLGILQASASKDWISTVAARFGITSDRFLAYGKIGGGWAHSNAALSVVNGGAIWADSHTDGGWLAGAGIEYAFASNWTAKLEYNYIGLSNSTTFAPPIVNERHDIQMLKVGANYQFGDRTPGTTPASSPSGGHDTASLAVASQNPIANMISVPFQNNTNFNAGPFDRIQDILNIQPVIPMTLSADWNLISRTIVPLIRQPGPTFLIAAPMELATLPSRCSFHLPIRGRSSGAWGRFLRCHPRATRYSGPGRYCLVRRPSSWSRRDPGLLACSSIINGRSEATRIDRLSTHFSSSLSSTTIWLVAGS